MRYRKNRKSPVYETTVLIIFMTLITTLSAVLFADVRKARAEDQASGILPASVLFEGECPPASDSLWSGEETAPVSEEMPAAEIIPEEEAYPEETGMLSDSFPEEDVPYQEAQEGPDDPGSDLPPDDGTVDIPEDPEDWFPDPAQDMFAAYEEPEADAFLLAMPVGTDLYMEEDPEAEGTLQPYEQASSDAGKEDPDDPEADPPSPIPMPDFRVTKTCETDHACPGDTVRYTITIENTGNVVLHSVVSTEKFLGAGVQAYFEARENVLLNAQRTQALISEIAPGQTSSLSACVVIPQNAQAQELVNMVEVTAQETGARVIQSEARIPLLTPVPARNTQSTGPSGPADAGQAFRSAAQAQTVNTVPGTVNTDNAAVRIIPQTMDPSPVLLFLSLCVFSVVTVLTILVSLHKDERKRRI